MKKHMMLLLLALLSVATVQAEETVQLVAVTESGRAVALQQLADDSVDLEIWLGNTDLSPYDPVIEIRGISRLVRLRRVMFLITPQIPDYSFLATVPRLSSILITHGIVADLGFISELSNLTVLALEMCRSPDGGAVIDGEAHIDLSGNPAIEYLGFVACGLTRFPSIDNVPDSLVYLDLSYNRIRLTEDDRERLAMLKNVRYVFLGGSEVTADLLESFPNLTLTDPSGVIPDYWR